MIGWILCYILLCMVGTIWFVFYFIPYIKNKWGWFKFARKIKKMSKKYTGETKEQLEDIATQIKEISKEEKL